MIPNAEALAEGSQSLKILLLTETGEALHPKLTFDNLALTMFFLEFKQNAEVSLESWGKLFVNWAIYLLLIGRWPNNL